MELRADHIIATNNRRLLATIISRGDQGFWALGHEVVAVHKLDMIAAFDADKNRMLTS